MDFENYVDVFGHLIVVLEIINLLYVAQTTKRKFVDSSISGKSHITYFSLYRLSNVYKILRRDAKGMVSYILGGFLTLIGVANDIQSHALSAKSHEFIFFSKTFYIEISVLYELVGLLLITFALYRFKSRINSTIGK